MRHCAAWGWAGVGSGSAVIITTVILGLKVRWSGALLTVGVILCLGGAIIVASGRVLSRQLSALRPVDDAYEDGHEIGYAQGWRECARRDVRLVSNLGDKRRLLQGHPGSSVPGRDN